MARGTLALVAESVVESGARNSGPGFACLRPERVATTMARGALASVARSTRPMALGTREPGPVALGTRATGAWGKRRRRKPSRHFPKLIHPNLDSTT